MLGTDLEEVSDDEIHVEIFPNRPDMLSEQGFARAFSSFIGVKTGLRKYDVIKSNCKVIVDKSVSMRPYTACAIVKGLKFNDESIREIMQIQEKLATTHGRRRKKSAYGIYPLKTINFPIKYIAKDPKKVRFRPLGLDKEINADEIEVLHPKGIEYKKIAKDWDKYPFFIDSKDNVMCMLPYTNSHDTGKIDENTTDVFIECTGNDLNNVEMALSIITTMLGDMGGEIYSLDIVYPDKTISTPNLKPRTMKFDLNYINKWLGLDLIENQAKKYLEKMGYGYSNGNLLIPAYRSDIMHQVDLAEDIAIAYGYENFEEVIPNVATIGQEDTFYSFKTKILNILTGLGFIETNTFCIINNNEQTKKMEFESDIVCLAHSVSEEYDTLRTWMIPSLMNVLANNKHHEYPQNIFEAGRVFSKNNNKETGIKEAERLAVLLCNAESDYTKIRQVLDLIFEAIKKDYKIEKTKHPSFISGRVARVKVKDKGIAFIGEINPKVISNFELEVPISAFELNLTELFNLVNN